MADAFKIRPARRGDREAVAALLAEAGYPEAADSSTMFWVLNHPEIDVIVAVDHMDRAIGFLSLSHRPQLRLRGRIATIDELEVAQAWRGKGVGSRLLLAGVERAKALSARRVEVRAQPRSLAQRAFFQRNGFAEDDCATLRLTALEK